jgi:hypothetical protein
MIIFEGGEPEYSELDDATLAFMFDDGDKKAEAEIRKRYPKLFEKLGSADPKEQGNSAKD